LKILTFKSSTAFRRWLETEDATSDGFWLRIFKKGAGERSITHSEALDQALCYGWIDGQKQSYDEHSWLQKFTPRRAKGGWSKLNVSHVERLMQAGQMTRAGLAAVEAAKGDGRWQAAYDSPRNAAPPDDFLKGFGEEQEGEGVF